MKLTKPLLTNPAAANAIFHFDTGTVDGTVTAKQQLQLVDLSAAGDAGVGLAVTAKHSVTHGGNGYAAVGFINGGTNDLGAISIRGDLGRIVAGDGMPLKPAVKSLTVASLGQLDVTTQAANGTLESILTGGATLLTVQGNVDGAIIHAPTGSLGTVFIKGSLVGIKAANSGNILVDAGSITKLTIGGSIVGGDGADAGKVIVMNNIATLVVGGSVVGGSNLAATNSGSIKAGSLGTVTLGGSLLGDIGPATGSITSIGKIIALKIGYRVRGNDAASSGSIAAGGDIGSITVGGGIGGGAGDDSGSVHSGGLIGQITVVGDLIGNAGARAGSISAQKLGVVKLGGDLRGSSGQSSGTIIAADTIASITVGRSVFSAAGPGSGTIRAGHQIMALTVMGDLRGSASHPVILSAGGLAAPTGTTDVAIGKVTVNGTATYAQILAGYDTTGAAVSPDAQISSVTVNGDWISGSIVAGFSAGTDTRFGTADDTLNTGTDNAHIVAKIGHITILGQTLGTPSTTSNIDRFGFVAQAFGAITLGGTVFTPAPGFNGLSPISTDFNIVQHPPV